jgi:TolA-binding protein
MDFNAILGALPTLGPIGLVLVILAYVGKQWLSSDSRYRAELDRLNTAHQTELDRVNTARDAELKELRDDIRELRRDLDKMQEAYNAERQLRFQAQEEAHLERLKAAGNDFA